MMRYTSGIAMRSPGRGEPRIVAPCPRVSRNVSSSERPSVPGLGPACRSRESLATAAQLIRFSIGLSVCGAGRTLCSESTNKLGHTGVDTDASSCIATRQGRIQGSAAAPRIILRGFLAITADRRGYLILRLSHRIKRHWDMKFYPEGISPRAVLNRPSLDGTLCLLCLRQTISGHWTELTSWVQSDWLFWDSVSASRIPIDWGEPECPRMTES